MLTRQCLRQSVVCYIIKSGSQLHSLRPPDLYVFTDVHDMMFCTTVYTLVLEKLILISMHSNNLLFNLHGKCFIIGKPRLATSAGLYLKSAIVGKKRCHTAELAKGI